MIYRAAGSFVVTRNTFQRYDRQYTTPCPAVVSRTLSDQGHRREVIVRHRGHRVVVLRVLVRTALSDRGQNRHAWFDPRKILDKTPFIWTPDPEFRFQGLSVHAFLCL
jgi:hypothetical protein